MFSFTKKQLIYIKNAKQRWNFKTGAVRSGKTFVDIADTIPRGIFERRGQEGLIVFLGVTQQTLERNVLKPLRDMFGAKNVGEINGTKGTAIIFGEEVYCLGAEKINQVSKIQGSSIKFCYGDEVAKWSEHMFAMLQSRLDKDYSIFHGALNPEHPNHWLKKFLDKDDLDIYIQRYEIDDNTTLSQKFIESLKNEYRGTVNYNRLILGLWANAEGLVYKEYADNFKSYFIAKEEATKQQYAYVLTGLDFGGSTSNHSLTCVGITNDFSKIITLKSHRFKGNTTPAELEETAAKFVLSVEKEYKIPVDFLYCDSAETVLINGIFNYFMRNKINTIVDKARKHRINDRINFTNKMINTNRMLFVEHETDTVVEALQQALWNEKKFEDERLDNGTTNIDDLDSFEYTFEQYMELFELAS